MNIYVKKTPALAKLIYYRIAWRMWWYPCNCHEIAWREIFPPNREENVNHAAELTGFFISKQVNAQTTSRESWLADWLSDWLRGIKASIYSPSSSSPDSELHVVKHGEERGNGAGVVVLHSGSSATKNVGVLLLLLSLLLPFLLLLHHHLSKRRRRERSDGDNLQLGRITAQTS